MEKVTQAEPETMKLIPMLLILFILWSAKKSRQFILGSNLSAYSRPENVISGVRGCVTNHIHIKTIKRADSIGQKNNKDIFLCRSNSK